MSSPSPEDAADTGSMGPGAAAAVSVSGYSLREEILHILTHGIAAVLAIVGLVFLVIKAAGDGPVPVVAVSLYAGCMIAMYLASTLYHSSFKSRFQPFFKMLDHAAIYFKIAGTYTPIALITLPQTTGLWIMLGVWSAAVVGTVLKVKAFLRKTAKRFSLMSLLVYLAMGWAGVLVIDELWVRLPAAGFQWLLAGGLCFTIGAVFYALKSMPYSHAIWHVFVVAGSVSHFVAIYGYVL